MKSTREPNRTLCLAALMAFLVWLPGMAFQKDADSNNRFPIIRYNSNAGLSSDFVRSLIQDKEGFIWAATDNGLNRFDGYTITHYKPDFNRNNTFNTVDFNCIAEDQSGNLWLGTNHSGINIYHKQTGEVEVLDTKREDPLKLIDNSINHILCDASGRMWISTQTGLNLYNPENHTVTTFSSAQRPNKNNPFGTISYGYQDSRGKILIGTWGNGLYVYDEVNDDFTQLTIDRKVIDSDSINRIFRITEDRQGNYWLGTWEGGLLKVQIDHYQSVRVLQHFHMDSPPQMALSSNIIYDLYEDPDGAIWAGTPFGLNIIRRQPGGTHSVTLIESGDQPHQLAQNDVYDILEDRSGIVWLATGGGGLHKIDRQLSQIESYTIPKLIEFHETQSVRSFIIDIDSSLLVGVNGLGFGKYLLREKRLIPYTELPRFKNLPPNLNAATCFLLDANQNLWIGTRYNGLFFISSKTGNTTHLLNNDPVTGTRSRLVNLIIEDRFGFIWAGTSNGLFRFKVGEDQRIAHLQRFIPDEADPASIRGNVISAITEDADNNLWVGTLGGALNVALNIPEPDAAFTFRHFITDPDDPKAIRSNVVYAIHEDQQQRIWVGTGSAGLTLFNKNEQTFSHFGKDAGIRGDAIFDIIEESGNLWLTTNNGLVRFRYSDDNNFKAETFTTDDGLLGNVIIDGAVYQCNDHDILIGSYYGFNKFSPNALFSNSYVPPVVVSAITVANQDINVYEALNEGLVLNHRQNGITFECAALSYSQPFKNNYAYILEGLDASWKRTDYEGRVINYPHVPPGRYTFRVRASNSSDVWSEQAISIPVRIKPHPLRSWVALVIYAIFLLGILIAIYYFLVNNIKIKQAYEIEKLERKKDENINQFKFRFFTNISHELLTPLSVLSYSIEDIFSKKIYLEDHINIMQRNVQRVMHLISQLLDFRKVESGSLRPLVSPGNLDSFIEQIYLSLKPLEEKKNIRVEVAGQVNQQIWFDHDKLDKIVCNLLSNAFRFTPENGRIIIRYQLYEKEGIQWLTLDVTDSGKGIEPQNIDHIFERFYQVKSVTGKTFGAGIGLALARNLAENHKGSISVENVDNLGARFSVNIPVSKEAYSQDEIQNIEIAYQSGNFIIDHDAPLTRDDDDPDTVSKNSDKKSILIVEDNHDFRRLLKQHLANFYHTLEAENGNDAWEICLNQQPDLVVTDMMMPGLNGIDLCKKLKTSIETSHIIVILLTARTDEETRYESYLANADSYISKPVNLRTLDTRIESLLEQRARLTRSYARAQPPLAGHDEIEQVEFSELDQKFLHACQSIIESKMMNPELNVLALSKEIGMSTSNLYRKTTSLTGMTPVEFIRHIRLQAAAIMLVKEGANVSETANRCGFTDISYFCKTFKKQFGYSPKKYQGQHLGSAGATSQ